MFGCGCWVATVTLIYQKDGGLAPGLLTGKLKLWLLGSWLVECTEGDPIGNTHIQKYTVTRQRHSCDKGLLHFIHQGSLRDINTCGQWEGTNVII